MLPACRSFRKVICVPTRFSPIAVHPQTKAEREVPRVILLLAHDGKQFLFHGAIRHGETVRVAKAIRVLVAVHERGLAFYAVEPGFRLRVTLLAVIKKLS